jgi:hypothetical protein
MNTLKTELRYWHQAPSEMKRLEDHVRNNGCFITRPTTCRSSRGRIYVEVTYDCPSLTQTVYTKASLPDRQ